MEEIQDLTWRAVEYAEVGGVFGFYFEFSNFTDMRFGCSRRRLRLSFGRMLRQCHSRATDAETDGDEEGDFRDGFKPSITD